MTVLPRWEEVKFFQSKLCHFVFLENCRWELNGGGLTGQTESSVLSPNLRTSEDSLQLQITVSFIHSPAERLDRDMSGMQFFFLFFFFQRWPAFMCLPTAHHALEHATMLQKNTYVSLTLLWSHTDTLAPYDEGNIFSQRAPSVSSNPNVHRPDMYASAPTHPPRLAQQLRMFHKLEPAH